MFISGNSYFPFKKNINFGRYISSSVMDVATRVLFFCSIKILL